MLQIYATTVYPSKPISYPLLHLILLLSVIQSCYTQSSIILIPNSLSLFPQQVTMYNSSNSPTINPKFIQQSASFNCSLSTIYTYVQSSTAYRDNSPYTITISGLNDSISATPLQVTITSLFGSITPTINGSQSVTCSGTDNCTLNVVNSCTLPKLNHFNYFDVIHISVSSLSSQINHFSYNVLCNSQYTGFQFQYGLLIQIAFCTVLVTIAAIYSNAWSIGGFGLRIGLRIVLLFNGILVVGGIIAVFQPNVVFVGVNVICWVFGIAGVWLCTNQILFLFKFVSFLRKVIFKIKEIEVRVLDITSLFISIGVCFGWWYSHSNWIVNDIIAVSMIIAGIKFFKFTSLKSAIICFSISFGIQLIFVLIIALKLKGNYNTAILNIFNNPFQLQIPAINPVYNQKCAWLPITSVLYPGCLMSYMRRFDTSRNTKVYIITCVTVFLVGSLLWMGILVGTSVQLPYGMIAQPATLSFITLFAWKRKEIRIVWTGKFYDQEFAHKEGLTIVSQSISKQRNKTQIIYSPDLFTGLKAKQQQSQSQNYEHLHYGKQQHQMQHNLQMVNSITQKSSQYSPEKDSLDGTLIRKESIGEQKIEMIEISSPNMLKQKQVLRRQSKFPQSPFRKPQ